MGRMRTVARGSLGILTISILVLSGSAFVPGGAGADISSTPDGTPGSIAEIDNGAGPLLGLQHQVSGLEPPGQAQPHSQPQEPVDEPQPHDVTGPAASLSNNWSGLVDTGSGATFTSIQG